MPIVKRPYDGSKGFNQAWSLMTRSIHTEMLAKPPARRLAPWPDPHFYQPLPREIPHATLNYNPSKRLEILSRVRRGRYTPKYTIQQPPEHYVEPGNLIFVPGPRLLELAQPRVLILTKHRRSTEEIKGKPKNLEKEREDWLALRAAPKPISPQPPVPKWKRKTTPLSREEREIRIAQLSKPTPRYLFKPEPWDPYKVSTRAKRARATKRILELAAHRELPEEALLDLRYNPYAIKKAALRYKATKRINDLAVPPDRRSAKNNDLREDAFQVPARALKAMCSKRTKELAKPVVRRGWHRRSTEEIKGKPKNLEKEREDWLALRAAPKPISPQPPVPKWKRKTTPLSREEREIRIAQLSKPTPRYLFKPEPWDPYKVSTRAKRARATKRILELAAHRELPEEALLDLRYNPYAIKKAALRYKATKRINDLAVPPDRRSAKNNDLREDAFQVPARALKAMCSKRTKELAKPVVRRGW